MTKDQLAKRVEELLASMYRTTEPEQAVNGALTVMIAAYGESSSQVKILLNRWADISKGPFVVKRDNTVTAVHGMLQNLKDEISAGLLTTIEQTVTADVLSDLVKLAHNALDESSSEGSKNVAAVLTAAAYEDTLRRLAKHHLGLTERQKLETVINKLKDAGILVSPQLPVVQGYLSFRNHALHADWEKIERGTVVGALALVEGLLLKQFGS